MDGQETVPSSCSRPKTIAAKAESSSKTDGGIESKTPVAGRWWLAAGGVAMLAVAQRL